VPGVYADDADVVLTSGMKGFLKKLRGRVGFDFVVTSGVRSLSSQAEAMYRKLSLYGFGSLSIYPDALVAGMEGAKSSADVLAILRQRLAQGFSVSDHLRGAAVDIRTRTLTTAQIQALFDAAKALGGTPGWEEDHLHIGDIEGSLLLSPWVWGSVALGILGVAAAVRYKRQRGKS
jgi:hypothetical protein